ncbi:hypothetical protein FVER14953_20541 [Fusarium verticillioides]|nr:hypothetical protein FVER14953_20541 [Fusarium verticillioides]
MECSKSITSLSSSVACKHRRKRIGMVSARFADF